MKMTLHKLGTIEDSTGLELGDLTIICGKNNLGKTYATYALYGALKYLRSAFSVVSVEPKYIEELLDKGATVIPLIHAFELLPKTVRAATESYSKSLADVFASKSDHFADSRFLLDIPMPKRTLYGNVDRYKVYGRKARWHFAFDAGKMEVSVQTASEGLEEEPRIRQITRSVVEDAIRDYLLRPIIPDVYISSTERTGVVMFHRELDFTRNRLLEALGGKARNVAPDLLFSEFHGDYPVPVRDNVDFIRNLPSIEKNESPLSQKHPEIIQALSEIIGGAYKASKDGFITYIPAKGRRGVKLGLAESSSSIRALLDVTFYLKNSAEPGDLFMIDEPELNLHPSNQRKLARLLARLVNCGVKVFMTTHSDYIVKEINTLLLLNQKGERFTKIAEEEKYVPEELLDASKVRVYIAEECLMKKEGNSRKTLCHSFSPAPISQSMGIEVKSFDETIDEMNRIQDRILWEAH